MHNGTENYPDAGIFLNYDEDDYSKGYAQIEKAIRALAKGDILQPYISDNDFISSNAGVVELGFNLYVFDITYQQNFTASQPIKVEFESDGVVPKDINGYAQVLTNKFDSISSDGQRHFDLFELKASMTSFFFIHNSVFFNKVSLQRSGILSIR